MGAVSARAWGRGLGRAIVAASLVGCAADPAGSADPDEAVDPPALEAWAPPDGPGPYGVGVRTVVVARPGWEDLTLEVWYPAQVDASAAPDAYDLAGVTFPGGAHRDAAPDVREELFPLVAFSHGFGGLRFQSYFLTEHLASHGFVVVAPDHPGTSLLSFEPDAVSYWAIRRPRDVADAVDAVAELGLPVDVSRYAAVGHSFGAWTSLVVGGGQLNADAFEAACAADAGPACDFFDGQTFDRDAAAQYAVADDRAEVVVALAPGAAYAFGPTGLTTVRQPLVLAGTRDGDLPWDEEGVGVWEGLAPPKRLALLEGAGHWGFTDLCRIAPVADCAGEAGGYMAPERTQALTQRYTLAHVRVWLGSEADLAWLGAEDGVDWRE